jgi:hypothetical protein
MSKKSIFLLLIILLTSTTYLYPANNNVEIRIMYFHATSRCEGCLALEENIIKSVNSLFSKELKSGNYNYKSLDFMDENNLKLVETYNIETQSLILSKLVDGKEVGWISLEQIWDYAGSYSKMKKYLDRSMNKFHKK